MSAYRLPTNIARPGARRRVQIDPALFGMWSALAAGIVAATCFAYRRRQKRVAP